MKKIILATTITLLAFIGLKAQDQIVKTNGDEIFGKVLRVSNSDIVYKKKGNIDGPEYFENIVNILYIKFENGTKEVFATKNNLPAIPAPVEEIVKRKNSAFLELGGNSILLSSNYERHIFNHKNENFIAFKLGYAPSIFKNRTNITATYNIGNGINFFEVGGGLGLSYNINHTDSFFQRETNYLFFAPIVGYRRQNKNGFLFKTFLTMLTDQYIVTNYNNMGEYTQETKYNYYPYIGFCFGYSF